MFLESVEKKCFLLVTVEFTTQIFILVSDQNESETIVILIDWY